MTTDLSKPSTTHCLIDVDVVNHLLAKKTSEINSLVNENVSVMRQLKEDALEAYERRTWFWRTWLGEMMWPRPEPFDECRAYVNSTSLYDKELTRLRVLRNALSSPLDELHVSAEDLAFLRIPTNRRG